MNFSHTRNNVKLNTIRHVGFMGMGKLGLPCALAIESKGHNVMGYDISPSVQEIIKNKKLVQAENLAEAVKTQKSKIIIYWVMCYCHSIACCTGIY